MKQMLGVEGGLVLAVTLQRELLEHSLWSTPCDLPALYSVTLSQV